jgi:hypothetical protein
MKKITIVLVFTSILLIGLIGCDTSIEQYQPCSVEMFVLFDNGIERTITKTVELIECTTTNANRHIFLSSLGDIRYTKPNHIGSNKLAIGVSHFEILSIKLN